MCSRLLTLKHVQSASFYNKLCKIATRPLTNESMHSAPSGWSVLPKEEVRSFMIRCMESVGATNTHSKVLAELLLSADCRGHYSHGVNRLEMYVNDVQTGMTVCDKEPEVLKETSATAWVDGNNVLGPVVGKLCIELAMEKAKSSGVGWVVAKGSNHYGIAGWYGLYAIRKGLIGFSFTNTSPLVVPTRGSKPVLGTNPIACGAPGVGDDHFMLDMATSTVAVGKIEMSKRKLEEIPTGWGCDSSGLETNNPTDVLSGGGLLPLGGMETSGGYKGSGLGMMVDILSGVLGGATYGPNVRKWMDNDRPADIGQCFIAVDPDCFAPGFPARLQGFIECMRSTMPMLGETQVLVPGDPETFNEMRTNSLGGIPYHPKLITAMAELAEKLGQEPPKYFR